MDQWVGCFRCNQPFTNRGPFHRTSWIWPTSMLVVNDEPLSHWPGSMCSQPRPLESGFRSILFLWRTFTNYVTHCERLSRYTKFPGGLSALHLADEKAIAWLCMHSIGNQEVIILHLPTGMTSRSMTNWWRQSRYTSRTQRVTGSVQKTTGWNCNSNEKDHEAGVHTRSARRAAVYRFTGTNQKQQQQQRQQEPKFFQKKCRFLGTPRCVS